MTKKIIFLGLALTVICFIFFFLVLNNKSELSEPANESVVSVNDIQYKVLQDKINSNPIVATFYYEALTSKELKTDTYNWENKKFTKSTDTYRPTYANKYAIRSINNLQKRMNLSKSPIELYGQLYFYGSCPDYELFIFDSSRTGKSEWKVIFLSDDSVKEVDVKKELDEVRLDSYQISNDAVYLFTRSRNENDSDIVVYKIGTSNYEVTQTVVPLRLFNVDKVIVQLDKIFVKNDTLLLATSSFNNVFAGQGIVLRYNFTTKTAETKLLDHTIHKVLPYKDHYLVLSDEKDSFKPVIKYYDQDFNLLRTSKIEIHSQYGEPVIGARDYFYSLIDDKLYGSLSVDGISNINYLIVMNAEDAQILYLAEVSNKTRGFILQDARFHQNLKGKYVDLNSF
ncbi:hypothetical protein J2Z22_000504 [Paenibacillus forsythiae]|uniref:Uncharacterized protein n=1 Tax=Paenibacillus forsythiae TaxID=365616 RepID=A0ABU3H2F1_9BACL|nr:hypothetical protein [Paenibacillus forsythiae]MDT3424991.1 hypothetical protein [Paenibacillus forsythiae]